MRISFVKTTAIIAFPLISVFAWSEPDTAPPAARWEQLTGEKFIYVRPFLATNSLGLNIESQTGKKLTYEPNVSGLVGSQFYYEDFFGIGGAIPTGGGPTEGGGRTRAVDFRVGLGFEHLYYNIDFQRYRSFYTTDIKLTNGQPTVNSALVMNNFGFHGLYVFSPDHFSVDAIKSQTRRQVKSGGSWLTGIFAGYTEASSPDGIIPLALQPSFGIDGNLQRIWDLTLLIRGGYGYTWVMYPKFFLGAYGLLGLGPNKTYLNYGEFQGPKQSTNLGIGVNLFFAAGYTGDKFSSSISFDVDQLSISGSDSQLRRDLLAAYFNIGYRFDN